MYLKILMSLIFITMFGVNQAQEWYAMARHGECFDLAKLNERSSLVKGAKTPTEMEEMMKKAGVDYTLEPVIPEIDGMLKLDVPSENWAMILVRKQFCKEFLEK